MKVTSIQRLLVAGCIIAVALAIQVNGYTSYFSLSWLQENMHYLQELVQERYWFVVAAYLGAYITVSCCALPGTTFFIIAAGVLFGWSAGVFFAMTGAVVGSTLLFLLSRYVIGSSMQRHYQEQWGRYNRAIERYGYYYMLCARLLAMIPFGFLNILAGMTLLPLSTFVWTTAVGMAPYIFLYVFAGQQLGTLQPADTLFSSPMLVFAATLLVRGSVIPIVIRYIMKSRQDGNSEL